MSLEMGESSKMVKNGFVTTTATDAYVLASMFLQFCDFCIFYKFHRDDTYPPPGGEGHQPQLEAGYLHQLGTQRKAHSQPKGNLGWFIKFSSLTFLAIFMKFLS